MSTQPACERVAGQRLPGPLAGEQPAWAGHDLADRGPRPRGVGRRAKEPVDDRRQYGAVTADREVRLVPVNTRSSIRRRAMRLTGRPYK